MTKLYWNIYTNPHVKGEFPSAHGHLNLAAAIEAASAELYVEPETKLVRIEHGSLPFGAGNTKDAFNA